MKKLAVFVMMFCVVISSNAQKRNSSGGNNGAAVAAAAGVVGTIAAAAYYENQMREMVEQSAMEWALLNKDYQNGDKLEMKLIEWEVKAFSDISSTSNLLFRYKRNDEPYEVILFILSRGWWNENGVVFTKVEPITINKKYWNDILGTLMEVASENNAIQAVGDSLIKLNGVFETEVRGKDGNLIKLNLNQTVPYSKLEKIRGGNFYFELEFNEREVEVKSRLVKLKGDEHIIGLLDNNELILDYNEKRINLFNKSTRDLIKLSQSSVNEIHKLLHHAE